MSKVIVGMTTSIDGFVADKSGSVDRLYTDLASLQGSPFMNALIEETGAVLMGRRTFAMGDPDGFAGSYEFQVPIFVVTHKPPPVHPRENERLTFTFVTDGLESAVAQAKAAAGDRAVQFVGGAEVAEQLLRAGLIDELRVDVMPVLLGEGLRFFRKRGPRGHSARDAQRAEDRSPIEPSVSVSAVRIYRRRLAGSIGGGLCSREFPEPRKRRTLLGMCSRGELMSYRLRRVLARLATPVVLSGALIAGSGVPVAQAGAESTYLVVYNSKALPAGATNTIRAANGTMVAAYPEIGVAVARSNNLSFSKQIKNDRNVAGVAATKGFATRLKKENPAEAAGAGEAGESGDFASLKARQWDMTQINAFAAQEITSGSRKVLVGDIDTGLDFTHPNLKNRVDFANSVSCIGGTTNTSPAAWMDDDGHGTHTAGTIAAGGMDGGILGVAPNVRIAGIKAGDANGFFFPEAVVCAFMWAGRHHMDVTNNSYFADPWLYNCLNVPEQRAIYEAESRAVNFAMNKGVTVVVAAGNETDDLGNPTVDTMSPDFPDGAAITRTVNGNCFVSPAMIPGVYTVSATGNLNQKSFYSSYGMPWVQAAAPGGDSRYFRKSTDVPNGRVLSTYPASLYDAFMAPPRNPNRGVKICGEDGQCATYVYHQGTSMAAPHVAGVAALITARFGHQDPETMTQLLNAATNQIPCPPDPYLPAWTGQNGQPAHCTGTLAYNSFYGHGQIDALKAVTGGSGHND